MTFVIDTKSLASMRPYIDAFPIEAKRASYLAVNATLNYAYAESSRAIRRQVNLPQDYIGSAAAGNRLNITLRATEGNAQGKITARQRPVSLARYALDRSLGGRQGLSVQVKPGSSRRIASAFLIKLKVGKQISQDNFNIGLAIRLKPGQSAFNKTKLIPFSAKDPTLFLAYGPSVDQVFQTVRADIEPQVSDYLQREWLRQFRR